MELSARPELERALQTSLLQTGLLPGGRPLYVAYSGGSDSTALLAALVALGYPVHALHVDHGWHAESSQWADFCCQQAQALGVPCAVLQLSPDTPGEGPEDRARRGRYALLESQLRPGDWVLTAQHQEDQAETLLLQLLRGTGWAGLAAMPRQRPLGQGILFRPLLQVSKQVLQDYLELKQLSYLHDPANRNLRYERVRLRDRVFPLLEDLGWPYAAAHMARAAENLGDVREIMEDWFEIYWRQHRLTHPDLPENRLSLSFLQQLSAPMQTMFIRTWLQRRQVPLPTKARMLALLAAVQAGGGGRCIQWEGGACWFQGQSLYLCQRPDFGEDWREGRWQPGQALPFRGWVCAHAALPIRSSAAHVLTDKLAEEQLFWRRRQHGESMLTPGGQHRPLKKMLLEVGVPPEWRAHLPLLWDGRGRLVLIPGFYAAPWAEARSDEPSGFCFYRHAHI